MDCIRIPEVCKALTYEEVLVMSSSDLESITDIVPGVVVTIPETGPLGISYKDKTYHLAIDETAVFSAESLDIVPTKLFYMQYAPILVDQASIPKNRLN